MDLKNDIVQTAIKQLTAFKDFQDREMGGLTIRDFDVWLGGYISGVSRFYFTVGGNLSEKEFENDLREIAQKVSECDLCKELGVTGVSKEEITSFNISK